MRHIQFVSAWIGTGTTPQDAQRCPSADLWQTNTVRWSNLRDMGQANVIPDPNVCVWEAWVEDAGVTLLEADTANYTILLDEDAGAGLALATPKASKSKDEKPNLTEKTKIESFLKAKGVKVADAAILSKKADANATRGQIAEGIIAYCNALPKKK